MADKIVDKFVTRLARAMDTSSSSTQSEIEKAFKAARATLADANLRFDDLVERLVVDRLPALQAAMHDEMASLRTQVSQQNQMLEMLRAEKALEAARFAQTAAAMNALPYTAEAGASLLDAAEMAALNQDVERRIERIRAMNTGGDFGLFEDLVIERLGYAAGWQTAFSEATDTAPWRIQYYRRRDWVPADLFVLAGSFEPIERRPAIEWTEEMYTYLGDLVTTREKSDMTELSRRMQERFGIEFPVNLLKAAKGREKRWREEALREAANAAAASARRDRRKKGPSEAETERQRVIREEAARREAEILAQEEADAEWDAAEIVSPPPPVDSTFDLWCRGIFA